jgi:hypothetical protein
VPACFSAPALSRLPVTRCDNLGVAQKVPIEGLPDFFCVKDHFDNPEEAGFRADDPKRG